MRKARGDPTAIEQRPANFLNTSLETLPRFCSESRSSWATFATRALAVFAGCFIYQLRCRHPAPRARVESCPGRSRPDFLLPEHEAPGVETEAAPVGIAVGDHGPRATASRARPGGRAQAAPSGIEELPAAVAPIVSG